MHAMFVFKNKNKWLVSPVIFFVKWKTVKVNLKENLNLERLKPYLQHLYFFSRYLQKKQLAVSFCKVGRGGGGHTPPFSKTPPFLEIQDVPTFYSPNGKRKVLHDSFNRFLYKFYLQSILILEEYLLKWWNANLI